MKHIKKSGDNVVSSTRLSIMQSTVQATDPFDDTLDFQSLTVKGMDVIEDIKPIETAKCFKLSLTIVSGKALIPMDRNKNSDPYVKVKMNNKLIIKTKMIKKTLNPVWDESCDVNIDERGTLVLKVFDKNLVGKDFMGQAQLDLKSCQFGTSHEISLSLTCGGDSYLGKFISLGNIVVRVSLSPVFDDSSFGMEVDTSTSSLEGKLRKRDIFKSAFDLRKNLDDDSNFGMEVEEGKLRKRNILKSAFDLRKNLIVRDAVVHVNLIDSQCLVSSDSKSTIDLFCKLTVGKETFKSRSKNGQWLQAFDFSWIIKKGNSLLIELYSQDTFMTENFLGKVCVDLSCLTPEVSHDIRMTIEDGSRDINFVVTISGIVSTAWLPLLQEEHSADEDLSAKYSWKNTFSNFRDVGHLSVKVIKAEGLYSADWFSESDPYCVLSLENTRLQTETKFETLEPVWQKEFKFEITDINEAFELTVYDEDSNQKGEFLGKIVCSLMKIENGETWFSLKDETLLKKAQGKDPKILLEMNLHWNPIRAAVQTLKQPKVEKKESDSKLTMYKMSFIIAENINRMKSALPELDDTIIKEIESILSWRGKIKSSCAYVGSLVGIWFFDLWMIPLGLLVPFIPPLISKVRFGEEKKALNESKRNSNNENSYSDNEKSSRKPSTDSLDSEVEAVYQEQSFTEIVRIIYDGTEFVAHILESLKNVFNFTVPLLSWIGVVMLLILTFLLYITPFRGVLMFLLTKVFFRKYDHGKSVKNFISKVPDNRQLMQQQNDPVAEMSDKHQMMQQQNDSVAEMRDRVCNMNPRAF